MLRSIVSGWIQLICQTWAIGSPYWFLSIRLCKTTDYKTIPFPSFFFRLTKLKFNQLRYLSFVLDSPKVSYMLPFFRTQWLWIWLWCYVPLDKWSKWSRLQLGAKDGRHAIEQDGTIRGSHVRFRWPIKAILVASPLRKPIKKPMHATSSFMSKQQTSAIICLSEPLCSETRTNHY